MNRNILIIGGAVVGVIVVGIGGLLAASSMQPDTVHVERSLAIAATVDDVRPQVADLANFINWSPWDAKDPNIKREISSPSSGVGATYSWTGNDQVGTGSMTIVKDDPQFVGQKLAFTAPMESAADIGMAMTPEGDTTKVTWTMDMPNDMMLKIMSTVGVVNMDTAVGPDFEQGLKNLKGVAEAAALTRIEAEKVAAALAEEQRLAEEANAAAGAADGGGAPPPAEGTALTEGAAQ